jgi:hypothetical protein
MEIKTKDYRVWYDTVTKTVKFQGSLRLIGMEEYAPIVQLLNEVILQERSMIILNLQELQFLNSSGINMILKFVLKVRQKANIQLTIQGSKNIPWQGKSLKNLQRLMPNLQLNLE